MKERLLTAVVAIPGIIWVLWYAPPSVFHGLVLLFSLLGIREFLMMAEKVGYQGPQWVSWLGGFGVLVGFWINNLHLTLLALAAVMALALIAHMVCRHSVETAMLSASAAMASVVYVAVFLGYLISVRMIDGGTTRLPAQLLSFYLLVNWGADTVAMIVGRTWGKHLLLPVISPKKTIEGALGGLLGSLLGGTLSHFWFFPELKLSHALLVGFVMSTVGQIGDWCESLLKRGSKVKDAAAILPGHGGVLDRLDSLLFNAPILYYYYRLFWPL